MVYTKDESWAASDYKKELIYSLRNEFNQFKKIKDFEIMPELAHTIKVTNPKTGVVNDNVGGFNQFSVGGPYGLDAYFRINLPLMQFHKYSLTEIENLMPWERDIYVGLLTTH